MLAETNKIKELQENAAFCRGSQNWNHNQQVNGKKGAKCQKIPYILFFKLKHKKLLLIKPELGLFLHAVENQRQRN